MKQENFFIEIFLFLFAIKLAKDIDKKYDLSVIKRMIQFYQIIQKGAFIF